MWKLLRQTISSKWNIPRQSSRRKSIIEIENINKNIPTVGNILYRKINVKFQNNKFGENEEKEKKKSKYNEEYYFEHAPPSFVEKVTWLGTSFALALNLKLKICPSQYHHEDKGIHNSCFHYGICTSFSNLWSQLVFSMPIFKKCILPETSQSKIPISSASEINKNASELNKNFSNGKNDDDKIREASKKYIGHTQNMIGLQLLEKDPSHAFLHFDAAGKLGCSKANFNLGVCFETGNGTTKDLEKAAYYYRLAASEDHGFALYNLGIYYLEGMGGLKKDENTGIRLIEKAAKQQIVEAEIFMGIHYFHYNKRSKAFKYFESAAKTSTDGKYYLGLCYENGWGTMVDHYQAAKLFSLAASAGHLEAIFSIAGYYEKGQGGIEQDINFANSLYELAANSGHKEAKYYLAKLKSSKFEKYGKKEEKSKQGIIHTSSSSPELSRMSSPVESNSSESIIEYLKDDIQTLWKKVYNKRSSFCSNPNIRCNSETDNELPHWTSTPALLSVI